MHRPPATDGRHVKGQWRGAPSRSPQSGVNFKKATLAGDQQSHVSSSLLCTLAERSITFIGAHWFFSVQSKGSGIVYCQAVVMATQTWNLQVGGVHEIFY